MIKPEEEGGLTPQEERRIWIDLILGTILFWCFICTALVTLLRMLLR